jgi:hypothetical protein
VSCGDDSKTPPEDPKIPGNPNTGETTADRNLERAMNLTDKTVQHYFVGDNMNLADAYNPFTQSRANSYTGIFEYTSAMEAVNGVLFALKAHKENGNTAVYDTHYKRYSDLLFKLFDNLDYYKGSFSLTSFTRSNQSWSVYAVSRASSKGTANVQGNQNVYDDQLWLIIELMRAHQLTNDGRFLAEAEYLMEYVLDGWDCTLDNNGKENGGIPWGHSYVTKHSASNGPAISPLVWLYEYYKNKADKITYRYIGANKARLSEQKTKKDYYLMFAEKIYAWQKANLLLSNGLYADMMGGCDQLEGCDVKYEWDGVTQYRAHTPLKKADAGEYSYNSGTMIVAACDLYRVTGKSGYKTDFQNLCTKSFDFFAKPVANFPGYYNFDDSRGTRILLYGYLDAYSHNSNTGTYIEAFQKLFDYAYTTHLRDGTLPIDLFSGWSDDKKNVGPMYEFSYAAEYARLSIFELEK